ncbi:MAG TPA: LysM peptidoglycan-binding domain-containing protein [Bacillota bacterium]|nr:LysM peptidoglycan-binding domain-containing protein [Bacillota bacterium]
MVLLLLSLSLSGCIPTAQSQSDEEKEPHFLTGKSRVNAMDYKGAIESFEKALEVNPRSAASHFELGWLYDQKELDPAAAIYHYERYLKLRQSRDNDDKVKTRIVACKQELARTVSLGPVTQTLQREFEKLIEQNKGLTEENKRLKEDLEKWRAAYYSYANRPATPTNQTQTGIPLQPVRTSSPLPVASAAAGRPSTSAVPPANASSPSRSAATGSSAIGSHTVKSGETPAIIARKYGIRVETLLAANPKLDPRRLKSGQTLKIPAP